MNRRTTHAREDNAIGDFVDTDESSPRSVGNDGARPGLSETIRAHIEATPYQIIADTRVQTPM